MNEPNQRTFLVAPQPHTPHSLRTRLLSCLILSCALAGSLPAAEKAIEGRFCFQKESRPIDLADCVEVSGRHVEVDAEEEARPFAWISSDGKTLVVDVVEPGETVVDLMVERGVASLALKGSPDRDWPTTTLLDVATADTGWSLSIPADLITELREIRLRHGRYDFGFRADHYGRGTRNAVEVGKDHVDLGLIKLAPLPRFTATVTNRQDTPLSGAVLIDDANRTVASADAMGRLAFEAECTGEMIECVLPDRFSIEYPGLAGSRVLVVDTRKDFDAGTVILGSGGALDLIAQRRVEESFPIEVEVVDQPSQYSGEDLRTLAETTIPANEDEARLDRLPSGKSGLYLRGSRPGEVISRNIEIREGEVKREIIEIRPTRLDVRVLLGEAPLQGAEVTLGVPHGKPDHRTVLAPADEDGRTSTTVWERGTLTAVVQHEGDLLTVEFLEVGDVSPQDVELRVSQTVIHGRIYNAETGEPFRKTRAHYLWAGEGNSRRVIQTDDEGRFEIRAARPGKHTVTFTVPDFVPAEATIETTSADIVRTLDVPVSSGKRHRLLVQWSDGSPVVAAIIVEVVDPGRTYQRWTTDSSGVATIPMTEDSTKGLWIIPREGSFAFVTISEEVESNLATIPQPRGALVIRTVDEHGEAAPSGHLGIRYGGRAIDPSVKALISRLQGVRFMTGSDGSVVLRGFPPGQYEIWAVQFDGDDLILIDPMGERIESFYFAGGTQEVTVDALPLPTP